MPLKVLLIDDSRTMRQMLKLYLKGGRFEFVEAETATRGLELLGATPDAPVDVVICDVNLPGMDGLELVRLVRASGVPAIARVPIVVVTGDTSAEMKARIDASGANGSLVKPVDTARLTAAVDSAIAAAAGPTLAPKGAAP